MKKVAIIRTNIIAIIIPTIVSIPLALAQKLGVPSGIVSGIAISSAKVSFGTPFISKYN